MPKPCSRPLTPNPFETYRDPVTGRWSVKYPDSQLSSETDLIKAKSSAIVKTDDALKRFPLVEATPARRRWGNPSRTKVA